MTKTCNAPVLLMLMLQAGCVSIQTSPSRETKATFPTEKPVQPPAPTPVQKQDEKPAPQPAPSVSRSRQTVKGPTAAPPAVLSLMQEAESSRSGGQLDNAAATLERAIRIQPRNAALWQQLARVRLQQDQPGEAEHLAKKSNVLAQGNRDVIQRNWAIIAEARRRKGDTQGAADAEAKAGH